MDIRVPRRQSCVSSKDRMRISNVVHKALSVPLSLVLIAGCSPLSAYALASGSSEDLQSASAEEQETELTAQDGEPSSLYSIYLPVLFRAANGMGEFAESYQASDASQWSPEYFLFDLGGEGAPELMVRTSAFSGAGLVHVFTVKSGEAVQIGSYWEWFGGSAGNDSGQLFIAGWNQGSSYVNEITLEGNKVVSTFLKSGKATSASPSGEIQMVNEFLASHRASWLESANISDYSLLERQAKYSLSKGTLTVAPAGEYTGEPKQPQVTVKFHDETLRIGVDYDVVYQNNVNAGVATATVVGLGDYKGALSARFNIARADLGKADATLAAAGAYSGAAKTPGATVTLGSIVLSADTDYSITYENNVNAGAAKATITGQGNYQGSKKISFTIAKAEMSAASLSIASAGAYTGSAKTPLVKASLNGRSLIQDVDYKLTYKDNKNAGEATVIVEGRGNYSGAKTAKFTIAKADVSKAAVSIALAGSYTGVAKMPSATVKLLGVTLRVGSDYALSYKNNKNAGSAIAIITGKGNYKGSKNAAFAIAKAANTLNPKASSKKIKASALVKKAQTFKAITLSSKAIGKVTYKNVSSASVAKNVSVDKASGAITVKKGTKKGSYPIKVSVSAAGDGNHLASSKTVTVALTVV